MNNRKALAKAQELHKVGRIKEAEQRYRKLLKKAPNNPEISFYLGMALLQTGKGREAVAHLEAVARVAPKDPIVQDHLGQALLAAGEYEKAFDRHQKAKALAPARPEILFNLGVALEQSGRLIEAEAEYRATIALSPAFFPALANLGAILHKTGRYREAVPVLRQAHELNPKAPEPLATLVAALERSFQIEEADRLTNKFLRIAPGHPAGLLISAQKQERCGNTESACELLGQLTVAPVESHYRAGAWYELGKLQDRQGHCRDAFESFKKSNELTASSREARIMDRRVVLQKIDAYKQCSAAFWTSQNRAKPIDDMPPLFFFVGFPRSGTTLMEQVLGAHPKVETTNENSPLLDVMRDVSKQTKARFPEAFGSLTDDQISRLRKDFLRNAREVTGSDLTNSYLVDKLPLNIVELGPIRFLLPEARAIVALRDPRDVCLSCFTQQFGLNTSMVQFLSLETTARFYCAVMELWLHYRETLSIHWMEYRYEDLVADFEGTVHRTLDFMGLPWHDSVSRYAEHAQTKDIRTPSRLAVTQPINDRAISRWRNYAEQLAPILPFLEPFVREFGYEPS